MLWHVRKKNMLKKMRKSPPIMYVKTFSKSHNTYVCTNIEGGLKVTYYGAVNRIQFAMLLGPRSTRTSAEVETNRNLATQPTGYYTSFTQNETISCRWAVSFRAGCFGRFRLWSFVGRWSLVYYVVLLLVALLLYFIADSNNYHFYDGRSWPGIYCSPKTCWAFRF